VEITPRCEFTLEMSKMDTWLKNWVEEVKDGMDEMDIVNSSKREFSILRIFTTGWRV